MSIELEMTLFAVLCFVSAFGMLLFGLGTGDEFEYKANKMEKWAKEELDRRADGEKGEQP